MSTDEILHQNAKTISPINRPKIVAETLTFVETEESASSVYNPIVGERIENPDDKVLKDFSNFKEDEEVVHLTNFASSNQTRSTPSIEKQTEPKRTIETKVETEYVDKVTPAGYEELTFNYPFNNYSRRFKDSHNISVQVDDKWDIIDFPSNSIFYDKECVRFRPLTVRHLAKISSSLTSKDFSQFLNVLDTCIDMDIRDVTQPDFKFFMFWLRLKSFPNTPLTLDWVSMYGNKNSTLLSDSEIVIIKTDKTREDVELFNSKGFDYPRVRDLEYSTVNSLTTEDQWLFDYAKYFVGQNPLEKVEHFEQHSEDFEEEIEVFKKLFEHGIEQYVYVKDAHFEYDKYLSDLQIRLEYFKQHAESLSKEKLTSSQQTELEYTYEMIGLTDGELYKCRQNPNMEAEEEKILLPFRSINLLPKTHLVDDSE